jgi:hypothetical protein
VLSPDGTLVAGGYQQPNGRLALGVFPRAGGPPAHVFPGFAVPTGAAAFGGTPDDGGVLYTTSERHTIWRQRLSGGAPEQVTDYSDETIFGFALSPDGTQILLARGNVNPRRLPDLERAPGLVVAQRPALRHPSNPRAPGQDPLCGHHGNPRQL